MNARLIRTAIFLVLTLSLAACSTIPTHAPITPTVELKSVKPLKLSFSKQELAFSLEVKNPNDYDLPIQNLSFFAKLDDKDVAQGSSNEPVTLPANDKAMLEIIVSTRIQKILGQLLSLSSTEIDNLQYDVKGFIKLANWPIKLPFKADGKVGGKNGQ